MQFRYLPPIKSAPFLKLMDRSWDTPPWYSSYAANNYGDFFYGLMRVYRPKKVVELGTKAGYSAYHMARGLKANGKGRLYCYDLWEQYPLRSVPQSVAQKNLNRFKDIVKLTLRDAIEVDKLHQSIDILHIDISNDGEKLEHIIPKWIDKVHQLIIIEGGSRERDRIDWMVKFHRPPIRPWLKQLCRRYPVEYFTLEPFPSVTIISKK